MKKPTVHYNSRGESGNIFFLLARVRDALRKERRIIDFNELRDKVLVSQSYEEALEAIGEVVTLIDDDRK